MTSIELQLSESVRRVSSGESLPLKRTPFPGDMTDSELRSELARMGQNIADEDEFRFYALADELDSRMRLDELKKERENDVD